VAQPVEQVDLLLAVAACGVVLRKPFDQLADASPQLVGEMRRRGTDELVDLLERDGLVRRSEDSTDRRVVVVEITARGRREIERVGELMRAPVARVIAGLSAEKRARLAGALDDLQEAFAVAKETANAR